jgi:peptidyl-prolyl cis-trans isomerase SurA
MKRIIVLLVVVQWTLSVFAQTGEKVLMTIDKTDTVTANEFKSIYLKNNKVGTAESKSVDDYLQLFVNFKLKVHEAQLLGMDTTQAFKRELEGYKKQLVKPYLTDSTIDMQLMKEAYDRMHYDIHAKHILILLPKNATGKEVDMAHKKIMDIYGKLQKGEKFEKLARLFSEDKHSAMKGGDIGYFTAFQMVYPFETAAYNTPVGQYSKPIRTRFGYHIVKVVDKRPSVGKVKVAHIMISNVTPHAKQRADSIYNALQHGADFAEMAKKYSDDKSTGRKGGELRWFGTGQMVPRFEKAAFSLKKIGDMTLVRTQFGWHIIKLLGKEPIKPFEEIKRSLKDRISKDARAEKSRKAVLLRIKNDNKYLLNKKSLADFYKVVDASIFDGKWDKSKAAKLTKPLFTMNGKGYSQQLFVDYLSNLKQRLNPQPIKTYIDKQYEDFINQFLINYEISHLDKKYPQYRYLLKEYHDGILLFNLMDEKVWTKAVKDTAGLESYFKVHRDQYMWNTRIAGGAFKVKDVKTMKALMKLLKKKDSKSYSCDSIVAMINKTDSGAVTLLEHGKFEKDKSKYLNDYAIAHKYFNRISKAVRLNKIIPNKKDLTVLYFGKQLPPQPKELEEVKGLAIADYQSYLDAKWIEELRRKYPVDINQDVLEMVKQSLKQK